MKELVAALNFDELANLEKDLALKTGKVRSLVSSTLKELKKAEQKICVTCGTSMNLRDMHEYTIVFGPRDFKKKASFCGVDCLEYFVTKIADLTSKKSKNPLKV